MRADNIDILKAICAFLIICIHVPFPGTVGAYFTALTRIAVPVFFMINRSKCTFLYLEYHTRCSKKGQYSNLCSDDFYR